MLAKDEDPVALLTALAARNVAIVAATPTASTLIEVRLTHVISRFDVRQPHLDRPLPARRQAGSAQDKPMTLSILDVHIT
ncbi:hypothetical protein O7621_08100 [Solwaraspora sp. WMMD937]|uniref:hypothetical protein n=1 Tax=Solwaraspora sp. WMMD937 TaxID=3016090 RepID=UPI00249BC4EF|nr:hypothetical protein [Solwaraspora sp. WMMD937]WFE23256.1 hypothetical protein O7621_08100 [Solwaraspora sp. WMMD937]